MEFVAIANVDRTAFRWLRSVDDPVAFRLLAGDVPILDLTWAPSRGSLAVATSVGGRWTFKRVGHLDPILTLRPEGAEGDAARLTRHTEAGAHHLPEVVYRIDFARDRSYRLHRVGHNPPAWRLSTPDGNEVAHIEPVWEGRTLSGGAVVVSPAGVDRPELAPLLAFVWYFIVLGWVEDEILRPLDDALIELKLP